MPQFSAFKGTFLECGHISPTELLWMVYFWIAGAGTTMIQNFTSLSTQTVVNWLRFIEQAVAYRQDVTQPKLSGEVGVDESKFSRRKYNRGKSVGDGSWILVGVERLVKWVSGREMHHAGNIAVYPVMNRNAATCRAFLERFVLPGSVISTDEWKGYRDKDIHELMTKGLSKAEIKKKYQCTKNDHGPGKFPGGGGCHYTVNHSKTFKDPDSGVDNNLVEGVNNGLKIRIPRQQRKYNKIYHPLLCAAFRMRFGRLLWPEVWLAIANITYSEGALAEPPIVFGMEDPHDLDGAFGDQDYFDSFAKDDAAAAKAEEQAAQDSEDEVGNSGQEVDLEQELLDLAANAAMTVEDAVDEITGGAMRTASAAELKAMQKSKK